jgi:SAM-dependent methyltransferase
MSISKKNKRIIKGKPTKATKADVHILYEDSVQCVESEIDFVDITYKEIRGKRAIKLREDFCGTMNTSCEWVRRRKSNIAYSIDIDQDVLDWGTNNKLLKLGKEQQQRINIIKGDVTKTITENMDIVLAMNFSYWIFKDRQSMTNYYRHIYNNLDTNGIFFLDCFGGPEAIKEMEEETEYKGYSYIWDQHKYNPITGDGLFYIHFKFDDGSKIKKAYTYDWRVWTLPEITEMLADAGFKPSVYWEGTGEDGEGNGEFYRTLQGEADDSWIAYIVAVK